MKFRFDINALRAIAVIGVMLFHFKIPYFEGGFSGVDIFYVISGYLMSRIIINSMEAGNFVLSDFYIKRVKRIVPALVFLVVTLIVSGFFLYLPKDYQLFSKNATASLLFSSNILYWKNSGYFDASSDTNILLHTWSLSVEWQFYLILPIILLFINRFFKNDKTKYLIFFVISTLLLGASSLIITQYYPSASFYLLPTRAWEMLLGGIAFLSGDFIKGRSGKWTAVTAYLVLIACLTLLNNQMAWPGPFTLVPALATFFIIVCNNNDFKILQNTFIQFLGKISYSLYLWHWPIYVGFNYLGITHTTSSTILMILMSFTLAYISYKWIESTNYNGRRILLAAFSLCILTGFLSMQGTNDFLFKDKTIEISYYQDRHKKEIARQFGPEPCFIYSTHRGIVDFDKQNCLEIQEGKKNFLLLGDSHAAQFSQSIQEMFETKNIHLSQATASGCFPILKKNGASRCSELIGYIYNDYLPKNVGKIDGVVLSANWNNAPEKDYKELVEDLNMTIKYLAKLKIKTIIIGQNEVYTLPYPAIAAREYEFGTKISANYIKSESHTLNQYLIKNLGNFYVDIYDMKSIPKRSSQNIPYMFDENHFTKYGADGIVNLIAQNKDFLNFLAE